MHLLRWCHESKWAYNTDSHNPISRHVSKYSRNPHTELVLIQLVKMGLVGEWLGFQIISIILYKLRYINFNLNKTTLFSPNNFLQESSKITSDFILKLASPICLFGSSKPGTNKLKTLLKRTLNSMPEMKCENCQSKVAIPDINYSGDLNAILVRILNDWLLSSTKMVWNLNVFDKMAAIQILIQAVFS